MDVISVLQPENHVARRRYPGIRQLSHHPASDRGEPVPSFPAFGTFPESVSVPESRPAASFGAMFREYPAVLSFPVLFFVAVAALLMVSPVLQYRVGLFRLGRISLPTDVALESTMRTLVLPEASVAELSGDAARDLPPSIQSVSYSEYRVRKGDTMSAILARSGLKSISTLLSVNGIDNARRIHDGQTLRLPSMDGIIYSVARGESLEKIAKQYSVPVTALLDANDLSASTIRVGQKLFIPGAALSARELRQAMGELFLVPVLGRLTSGFGYRSDPFTGVRSFHTGIDLAAPTGTPVRATLYGRVATTGYSNVYGNYVIVTHDDGYQSLYGHLSSISVRRGQTVEQGVLIGRVGNTGYSTGSHLHFSVYKNGKMVNPRTVLN